VGVRNMAGEYADDQFGNLLHLDLSHGLCGLGTCRQQQVRASEWWPESLSYQNDCENIGEIM